MNVTDKGKSSSFSAKVELPSGTGPFPAVVVLGGFGADTATIKAAGAAVINYDPLAVGKEGTPRNNKQGAFYSIYGAGSTTGMLMAWAWGVSRIIDVIEQSDGSILKADAMGVTGCSRYGKGAFVIGVFDQRIALTMPIESGTGGVPAFRGDRVGERRPAAEQRLRRAAVVRRRVRVLHRQPATACRSTPTRWSAWSPRAACSSWTTRTSPGSVPGPEASRALGGAEVYKALGAGDNITYWSDVTGRQPLRLPLRVEGPAPEQHQEVPAKTGTTTGVMRISSKASGNLVSGGTGRRRPSSERLTPRTRRVRTPGPRRVPLVQFLGSDVDGPGIGGSFGRDRALHTVKAPSASCPGSRTTGLLGSRPDQRRLLMASLFTRLSQFIRTPQGRRIAQQAVDRASKLSKDPATRAKIDKVRAEVLKRTNGRPKP